MQDGSSAAAGRDLAPATRPWGSEEGLIRRGMARGAALFGLRPAGPAPAPARVAPALATVPAARAPAAPSASLVARRGWADRLWGPGLSLPGGADEVLRLAALLPLTPEVTLLLAGGGVAAAGSLVAGARGCYVAAFEGEAAPLPPPSLRKVTAGRLDAAAPGFRAGYHHHAMLLEPARFGAAPEALLRAAAAALKPRGQIVVLDLVARGLSAGPAETRWLAAEGRTGPPPQEAAMPAALQRAGFDLHVVEDAGRRQRQAVTESWAALVAALRDPAARPDAPGARALVAEAEAWLLRLRLLQDGRLRLLRWHATLARPPG